MKLSIVSPVYNADAMLDELVRRIIEEVEKINVDFEIILVEDGGTDNSWEKIRMICKNDGRIKGVKLSRNFGQHYAITAGISKAQGDNIVLMDCDLQDDPIFISALLEQRKQGFDVVFTKRKSREHGLFKSINSWLYNRLFHLFSDKRYHIDIGSMVLFSNQVGRVFLQLKDKDRLYLQMLKWIGFQSTIIEVDHKPRYAGKSTYSFMMNFAMGLQGWTSHSTKLLNYSISFGFILALLSFFAALSVVVRYLFYDFQPGWPSIIISILFSTGIILLSIGIVGIYIGKIFEQVKNRPIYVIEREININE